MARSRKKESNNEANKPALRCDDRRESPVSFGINFTTEGKEKNEKSKEDEVADSTFNANQRIARHRELGKLSRVTYPGNETLGLETIFDKSPRREMATRGVKAEEKRFPLVFLFFFLRVSHLRSLPISHREF